MSHILDPYPVTNGHTFSTLVRDVLYGRHLVWYSSPVLLLSLVTCDSQIGPVIALKALYRAVLNSRPIIHSVLHFYSRIAPELNNTLNSGATHYKWRLLNRNSMYWQHARSQPANFRSKMKHGSVTLSAVQLIHLTLRFKYLTWSLTHRFS